MWTNLTWTDEHGVSQLDRLEQVEESGMPVDIPEILVPDDVHYIWAWFFDLHVTRPSGFGAGPITYTEIQAWMNLTKNYPTAWEIQILRRLDSIFLSTTYELNEKKRKK